MIKWILLIIAVCLLLFLWCKVTKWCNELMNLIAGHQEEIDLIEKEKPL